MSPLSCISQSEKSMCVRVVLCFIKREADWKDDGEPTELTEIDVKKVLSWSISPMARIKSEIINWTNQHPNQAETVLNLAAVSLSKIETNHCIEEPRWELSLQNISQVLNSQPCWYVGSLNSLKLSSLLSFISKRLLISQQMSLVVFTRRYLDTAVYVLTKPPQLPTAESEPQSLAVRTHLYLFQLVETVKLIRGI